MQPAYSTSHAIGQLPAGVRLRHVTNLSVVVFLYTYRQLASAISVSFRRRLRKCHRSPLRREPRRPPARRKPSGPEIKRRSADDEKATPFTYTRCSSRFIPTPASAARLCLS